jgi:DNA repair exonuclease SbcCD ATPase subunit
MKFGKLRIKNYVYIKKAAIDLDYEGVTHIKAKNKDAENNNGEDTNGVGKSVLFGAIPEIHWGKSPTGKQSAKLQQASTLAIEYKDVGSDKDTYEVLRRFGKKKGFKIKRNGKDINIRTIDLSEKRAEQILGMSEDDFYAQTYISSLKQHPLIIGSAADRERFIVNAFGLHSADTVRKLLNAEYREAQKHRAAYLEVRSLFEEMREKSVPTDKLEEQEEYLQALEEKREKLMKRFRKAQKVRDLLMFEKDNEALIAKINKLCPDLAHFDEEFKTVRKNLRRAKEIQHELREWDVYDAALVAYHDKSKPIRRALMELLGDGWESETRDVRKKAQAARESVARRDSLKDQVKEARKQVESATEVVLKPKHDYEKCIGKIAKLNEELEHVREFHDGKCPTCGAAVEARPDTEIKDELDKWKARRSKAKAYASYEDRRTRFEEGVTALAGLQSALDEADKSAEKKSKWLTALDLVQRLPDLPGPPGAVRPEGKDLEVKIEKYQKRVHTFESVEPIVSKLQALADLPEADRELAADFEEVGEKLSEINSKISDLSARINNGKEAIKGLQKMAERGKTLKRLAADAPVLKALIDVHSNKGLKKLMVERCAKMIEQQINKMRRLFFAENFVFEFKYEKRLEFLVHRKVGKHVMTSDVCKLSGAEQRLFTVLLVLARITLLPKTKRTNLLVLDEPEANLGPARQNLFVKALPLMNKIVPHIVVLSPRTDLQIPGARVYSLIKDKGVTTLIKGNAT